jgi:hypothetical protein
VVSATPKSETGRLSVWLERVCGNTCRVDDLVKIVATRTNIDLMIEGYYYPRLQDRRKGVPGGEWRRSEKTRDKRQGKQSNRHRRQVQIQTDWKSLGGISRVSSLDNWVKTRTFQGNFSGLGWRVSCNAPLRYLRRNLKVPTHYPTTSPSPPSPHLTLSFPLFPFHLSRMCFSLCPDVDQHESNSWQMSCNVDPTGKGDQAKSHHTTSATATTS